MDDEDILELFTDWKNGHYYCYPHEYIGIDGLEYFQWFIRWVTGDGWMNNG